MHVKQHGEGDIAGRFIDTVTLLGELAARHNTLRFTFLHKCIVTQFKLLISIIDRNYDAL